MRLADLITEDILHLNGDIPVVPAARRMAEAGCESAPVFRDGAFLGLFVPAICWSAMVSPALQEQPVANFLVPSVARIPLDSDITAGGADGPAYLIGLDDRGAYVGHIARSNLPMPPIDGSAPERPLPEMLLDSLPVGVLAIDTAGILSYVNRIAADLLGINKDDLLGSAIKTALPRSRLGESLTADDMRIGTLSTSGTVLFTAHNPIWCNGVRCGAVSVFQKMEKFEDLAAELEVMKDLAAELNAIFENSYDGIYITDGEGYTLRVNKAYERITGLKRENLLSRNMKEIVANGLISESLTFKIKESGVPMTITQKIHGSKEILVSGVPIFNENGKLSRVITSVRDMTELNLIRSQLEKSKQLASRYEEELNELRSSQSDAPDFVCNSKKMQATIELALRVARVDSTVLIQGESGSGKEIVANLIHQHSPRSKTGSFIKINCSAIPSDLLESELFGYEEGAFTGARRRGKPGMFELAHNGTLFLDEIGTISMELQVKLLRVIQFSEIMPLGGVETRKVNIRLLAATSKNLEVLMREKKFREDLYYRLKVVPIHVPPLRERRDDIFPLTVFYLEKFNRKYQLAKKVSSEAMDALTQYLWPGNVRELVNLIERLVVTTADDVIYARDLPASIVQQDQRCQTVPEPGGESLNAMLNHIEKEILVRAFRDLKSTRKVGRHLKISQSAVMRKVKKHRLQFKTGWNPD
ncbi:hypothetical protein DSCO28_22650 [Desulfosarcina ovata subsp. sediminis]|uniref:HTH-type transcriptional regulatory protein TyrR n=1 Tax=Desulfosarcina ovata subsp. sediminis TaxID=885957 RepID=A0A5K7ZPE4_9BACT|nr:sigma 54-interacting transcriptional regulator [Desulfosarcina ovata]BBO81699.1 hypothetical protein DSCO28_22650 [Desulfosarcina ovata subsp. sediminis]